MPRDIPKDESLTDLLRSAQVSEPRVMKLEADLSLLRERVAALETVDKSRRSSSNRSFQLKMIAITAASNIIAFVVAYVLTKLHII